MKYNYGYQNAKFLLLCLFGYIALFALSIILFGCSSTPTKQFNSEDTQDGSCYATMGGIRGYCNAIDEKTIDVFCNNCYYNEEK